MFSVQSLWECIVAFFDSLRMMLMGGNPSINFPGGLKCVIEKPIGEGAFSYVYKARCGDQYFALKKVLLQSEAIKTAAQNEIDNLRRFVHPNIVQLVSTTITRENGTPSCYLLFPYAYGGTLRDELRRQLLQGHRRGNIVDVLKAFLTICKALSVLHDYKPVPYVHRDIKLEVSVAR